MNSNSFLFRYDNFKNLNVMEHDNCMIYSFSYGLNLKDNLISYILKYFMYLVVLTII